MHVLYHGVNHLEGMHSRSRPAVPPQSAVQSHQSERWQRQMREQRMRKPVVTHHLEMTNPSQLVPARQPPTSFSLVQVEIPCPALNRFLYTAVGGDWYWTMRLGWSYVQWQTYLERAELETWIAYVAGTPAGYFELERQAGENIEIKY